MPKTLALGMAALAVAISSASATITFDLRASTIEAPLGTISSGGKQVNFNPGASGAVDIQVWAQVTNVAPTNPIFGVQVILGSIRSSGIATNATGALSPATFATPFDNLSTAGTPTELSAVPDGVQDLGSNSTTTVSSAFIKFRKDPLANGSQVGSVFFASNQAPAGATVNPIANGFEFLMGSTRLSISNFSSQGAGQLNWVIPTFTTPANRGQIAQWTDGDGAVNNGNTNLAEMTVGPAINLVAVPEPSAFGMVVLGAMGLAGFRRMGLRRS